MVLLVAASWAGPARAEPAGLPAPLEVRLENGLRVVFQHDPDSPVVAACAFVHTSSAQETWNAAGVRELLQIMGEQTQVPAGEPEQAVPPAAEVQPSLSRDYAEAVLRCLPEDLPAGLQRLRWALFSPDLSEEPFRYAQHRLRQEVLAAQAQATRVAQDALVARLYPQWPGSWPLIGAGAATSVNLEYAREFHQSHYQSNDTVLAICGGVPWETVRPQVEKAFGTLLPGPPHALQAPVAGAAAETDLMTLNMPNSEVCAVGLGGRAPTLAEPDYPAAAVMIGVLGSGRGSRLYHRLREEQNASYTIEAGITPSQVCPYVFCLATCAADKLEAVRTAMLAEAADLGAHPPTPEEVARASRVVAGQFLLQQQDDSGRAHYLGMFALLGGDQGLTEWRSFADRLHAVTPEQVQASAQHRLGPPTVVAVRGG